MQFTALWWAPVVCTLRARDRARLEVADRCGDDFPFQSRQICVTVPIGQTDGSQRSSPAAAATATATATATTALVICEREAPQVMEADPWIN